MQCALSPVTVGALISTIYNALIEEGRVRAISSHPVCDLVE